MEIGPVEYLILGFQGTQIHDEFAPAIERLVENNLIHIIDLVFVKKDELVSDSTRKRIRNGIRIPAPRRRA